MAAILFTNAMIMEPAKLMDLVSVILDSSTMTVPVNIQRSFMIEASIYSWCFARFPGFTNQSKEKYFKKYFSD